MRERHVLRLVPVLSLTLSATAALAVPLPRFPASALWNQDVSAAPLHVDSALMISTLAGLGGFGNGRMQIDFSFHVVHAPPGSPIGTTVALPGYYSPDCDPPGTGFPLPAGAAIEGQTGLACDNSSNDCHLLVVDDGDCTLYELYRANAASADQVETQCLAIWRLDLVYPPEGRGDHCTSADAAGFPIAPLLFNADEIAASLAVDPSGGGDLGHAIRFVLPNARMASDGGPLYVRPATHAGGPAGPVDSVPYGARLRLRASFPPAGYNPAASVILNTFKRYGIVLADGGTVALTAETDLYTTTRWTDLGIDSRTFDLTAGATDVAITDFEVVDTGGRIAETYDCVRTCASLAGRIVLLRAVKAGGGADAAFTWSADSEAAGYNVWYVRAKEDIRLARQSSAPPATLGCAVAPALPAACADLGAVAREAPSLYFYQVRARCTDTSEGP